MPTTFQHVTPSVFALLKGEITTSISRSGSNETTITICDRAVRAYRLGQRQPLDDKQQAQLRRRLLYVGGSLYIVSEQHEGMDSRRFLRQINRKLDRIMSLLGITIQHLQQEATRIDEIRAKKLGY